MVRAPCCEKMGLKKGPWTPEEDKILISHIQKHGHTNWRALPKQAGLLRCGKSCRLRWINYLRPDIKRGNFTQEEEDSIIKLHEMLGNRWSAIAAKLPGRTDNEIKNVWHTHLKKRLKQKHDSNNQQHVTVQKCGDPTIINQSESQNSQIQTLPGLVESPRHETMSPQPSSSDLSSTATDNSIATVETNNTDMIKQRNMDLSEILPVMDQDFWWESSNAVDVFQLEWPTNNMELGYFDDGPKIDDGMDFWYDIFCKSGGTEGLI